MLVINGGDGTVAVLDERGDRVPALDAGVPLHALFVDEVHGELGRALPVRIITTLPSTFFASQPSESIATEMTL